jgi:hypothetical protein
MFEGEMGYFGGWWVLNRSTCLSKINLDARQECDRGTLGMNA